MSRRNILRLIGASIVACLVLVFGVPLALGEETNPVPTLVQLDTNSLQILQQHYQGTLKALEQLRQDSETTSKSNADSLVARLNLIEQALNSQHQRELDSLQQSNRVTLLIAGGFAVVGFFGLLLTVYILFRTRSSLPAVSAPIPFVPGLPEHLPAAALSARGMHLVTVNPVEQSSARFLGALGRLEQKLHELEHTANSTPSISAPAPLVTESQAAGTATQRALAATEPQANGTAEKIARVTLMLGKGQTLLNLNKPENALACFEELLTVDPTNIDAFIKKGQTLEKLRRLDEAVATYDRAIAVDGSATMAYLYKAGVFNRLERFNEALACYEQALHAQEKKRSESDSGS